MTEQKFVEELQAQIETKQTFHISYNTLEDFTENFYGKRIELAEITNDTTYEYTVTNKPDEFAKDDMERALKKGEVYNYDTILNDLCSKGYIAPGKYFVRVCW